VKEKNENDARKTRKGKDNVTKEHQSKLGSPHKDISWKITLEMYYQLQAKREEIK